MIIRESELQIISDEEHEQLMCEIFSIWDNDYLEQFALIDQEKGVYEIKIFPADQENQNCWRFNLDYLIDLLIRAKKHLKGDIENPGNTGEKAGEKAGTDTIKNDKKSDMKDK